MSSANVVVAEFSRHFKLDVFFFIELFKPTEGASSSGGGGAVVGGSVTVVVSALG